MLENQLGLMVAFKLDAELVEALYSSRQFDSARQVDRDRKPILASAVQKGILNVLASHLSLPALHRAPPVTCHFHSNAIRTWQEQNPRKTSSAAER